eukprot:4244991-Pleurochrysis_carterae.AAC.4
MDTDVDCTLRRYACACARAVDGYPINWLRNRGIGCVHTSHYFALDIDFWPSAEIGNALLPALRSWPDFPQALVIPNFQRSGHGCRNSADKFACRAEYVSGELTMPRTFAELQSCIAEQNCAVFDSEFNPAGQSSTDVGRWKRLQEGKVMQLRCLQSARYEPFVVLRRGCLLYTSPSPRDGLLS